MKTIIIRQIAPIASAITNTPCQPITFGSGMVECENIELKNHSDDNPAANAKVCERITLLGQALIDIGV